MSNGHHHHHEDVHHLSRKFEIVSLAGDSASSDPALPVQRAGFIGFVPPAIQPENIERWKIMWMKPTAKHDDPNDLPKPQIPKGSRQAHTSLGWKDVDHLNPQELTSIPFEHYEAFPDTALREGAEETGIPPRQMPYRIKGPLYNMGVYTFTSHSSGELKAMDIVAAEMKFPIEFGPLPKGSEESGLMTFAEFKTQGREEHVAIIEDVLKKVQARYKEQSLPALG